MLRCGLDLDGRLLALAAASHSGEDFHVAGVREILAGAGLDEGALACPAALPLDEQCAHAVLRRGGGPERLFNNCSGKHAAMAATCVAAGWPVTGYQKPDHPLQRAILDTAQRLAGEPGRGRFAPWSWRTRAVLSAGSPMPCAPIRSGRRALGGRNES